MTPRRPSLVLPTLVVAGGSLALASSLPDGGVGPDAAAYLRMATWLADGGGLDQVAATPSGTARFATWPVGYPALVSLGMGAGLDAWWAARAVAALVVGACALLLRWSAPRDAATAMWWLATATPLAVFSSATSEGPFLVALLALALAAARIDEGGSARWSVALGLSATAAFLLRYLGAFSLAVAALVVVRRLRHGGVRAAAAPALATVVSSGAMAAVLASHQKATGHFTGIARLEAPESWGALALDLVRAGVTEFLPTVKVISAAQGWWVGGSAGAFALAAGAVWLVRAPSAPTEAHDRTPTWLAFTGALYLAALAVLRFSVHFDRFGWRLLAPGSVLLWLALWLVVARRGDEVRRRMGLVLPALAGLSVFTSLALAGGLPGTAQRTQQAVLARYAALPSGCVVGPHDVQLPWLRPDLVPAMPFQLPHDGRTESVDAFRERLEALPFDCVRVEVRADLDPKRVHPSWMELASQHADGTFLALR